LIKGCENYELSEKESLETVNKILGKPISRRTYYNYKKKLYDKEIINQLKGSIYDNHMMRCLISDLEDTDSQKSLQADFLVAQQFPDRKDIFHDTEKQITELENLNDATRAMIIQFENQMNEPLQRYTGVPRNANIRKEFVKCGKKNCNDCPHGPYYYAYWRDPYIKKLKKKYIGLFNPK
jgi:hypothetical protein